MREASVPEAPPEAGWGQTLDSIPGTWGSLPKGFKQRSDRVKRL